MSSWVHHGESIHPLTAIITLFSLSFLPDTWLTILSTRPSTSARRFSPKVLRSCLAASLTSKFYGITDEVGSLFSVISASSSASEFFWVKIGRQPFGSCLTRQSVSEDSLCSKRPRTVPLSATSVVRSSIQRLQFQFLVVCLNFLPCEAEGESGEGSFLFLERWSSAFKTRFSAHGDTKCQLSNLNSYFPPLESMTLTF